jgi:hypothetical protein
MVKPHPMLSIRFLLSLTLASMAMAVTSLAQDSRPEQALETERLSSAAGLGRVEAPTKNSLSPIQSAETRSEFGEQVVIKRQAAFDPWRVEINVQGFHTDNVALAPRRVEDFFLRSTLDIAWRKPISTDWVAELGLSQDFMRYDEFSSLNYDKSSASAGVSTRLDWLGGATFTMRYLFDYLTEEGFGSRILSSQSILVGVLKSWKLSDKQRLFVGLISEPDLAVDPDLAVRHEHGFSAGWTMKITERFTTRLSGRAGYHTSPNTGRDDWNYSTRLTATYQMTDWASINASTGLNVNRSNVDRFDYRNMLTGAWLGLQMRF